MFVCLFVCLFGSCHVSWFQAPLVRLGSECLGSKIKDGVLLVEHLCLPGVQPSFRLKIKRII